MASGQAMSPAAPSRVAAAPAIIKPPIYSEAAEEASPSSSQPPMISPAPTRVVLNQAAAPAAKAAAVTAAPDIKLRALLSAGDRASNGYVMAGTPDGLGAFPKSAKELTVLMNHEFVKTDGIVRAHGGKGSFVSEWTVNMKTLEVTSGEDLIKQVYGWNATTQASELTPSAPISFNRFCSADLPEVSAFYNAKTKLGTKERLFMNGEEGGATGYAVAHVATGANKGNSYLLGKFNLKTNGSNVDAVGGWENLLANPWSGDQTVVVGNNDGGTNIMLNSVAVYKGTKTNTGTEVDKAGLTNGAVSFVSVAGHCDASGTTNDEINDTAERTTGITSGTPFTLSTSCVTTFSRPEDGAWADAYNYYFVTTDQLDKTELAGQTQKGGTRLWHLHFNADWTSGTIDVAFDASKIPNGLANHRPHMFDNISVNQDKTISLLEDAGAAEHNGKTWLYNMRDGSMSLQTQFKPALFGDVSATGVATAGTHTKDEETSGIIDLSKMLNINGKKLSYSLLVVQDHSLAADLQKIGAVRGDANPVEIVEGGQLLMTVRPSVK